MTTLTSTVDYTAIKARQRDTWASGDYAADYVPSLLDRAQARAASEGLVIATERADAEALPFPDGSFDVVLSSFGVMFAPNQEQSAAELVRACRPGGPAGVRPPVEWGDEARLPERFGTDVASLAAHRRQFVFRYRSAEDWLETFRTYYGPTLKAFSAVDGAARVGLERDLLALAKEWNTSLTGTLRVPSDYLEVVAVKAG